MTSTKDYPEHPSLLFLTGLMDAIDDQIKKDPGLLELIRQTAPGGEPPNHFMGAALPLRGWPG